MVSSEGTPLISKGRSGALRAVVAAALLKSSREAALQRLLRLLGCSSVFTISTATQIFIRNLDIDIVYSGFLDILSTLRLERH